MLHGDLSNAIPPRAWVIFEDTLGFVPKQSLRREWTARTLRKWNRAMQLHRPFETMRDACFNLGWRYGLQFDVVTFLPEEMTEPLEAWLDAQGVPYSVVLRYDTPQAVASRLSHRPEVLYVFHGNPAHQFAYGNRGWLVDPLHPVLPTS